MEQPLDLPLVAGRRRARAIGRGLAGLLVAALTGCASPAVNPTPLPRPTTAPQSATAAASPSAVAAPRPADARVKIVSPTTGETLQAGPVKVTLDYGGPTLVPAAQATKLDDYHLHYFLDEDAKLYMGGAAPIPAGNPRIVHSAAKEVNFDNVAAGTHTVTVIMTGNNHVGINPPVSDSVTFTTK
jgi:hypothetical protein